MSGRVSKLLLTTGAAAALLAGPAMLGAPQWLGLGPTHALAAGKGHEVGNKGGQDKSEKPGKPQHKDAKSEKHSKSEKQIRRKSRPTLGVTSNGGITFKSNSRAKAPTPAQKGTNGVKIRNLNAQLGGLNSLKRNINGLMNSSDPRMAGIRAYVAAGAKLAQAEQTLASAKTALSAAQAAYLAEAQSFGLNSYDGNTQAYSDLSLNALAARLDTLNAALAADPQNAAISDEIARLGGAIDQLSQSEAYMQLSTVQAEIAGAQDTVQGLQTATSDDALKQALLEAANQNRVAETGAENYLTPDILAWARQTLGVGEYQGLIDTYLAQQQALATDTATGAVPVADTAQ